MPGEAHGLGGGAEEPAGQVDLAVGQGVSQCGRFEGGNGHGLPVDGVEAGERVPGDQQPGRECPQPLVPAPLVGGEPVGADVIERAGTGDRGGHLWWGEGAGEGQEAARVGGVVAGVPGQGQDPPVVLLGE